MFLHVILMRRLRRALEFAKSLRPFGPGAKNRRWEDALWSRGSGRDTAQAVPFPRPLTKSGKASQPAFGFQRRTGLRAAAVSSTREMRVLWGASSTNYRS